MKFSGFAFVLIGIILASAGLVSKNIFTQIPPDILVSIPSGCQYVSVINMQQLMESPLFGKSQQGPSIIGQIAVDLAVFAKETGVDPARDISHLLLAKSGYPGQAGNQMIAIGQFNKKEILRYILSRNHFPEQKYRGAAILPIGFQNGISYISIAFLNDREIAFGPNYFVREVLDVKAGVKQNILSDPEMSAPINSAPSNEMIWFVGTSQAILSIAPVPIPIQSSYRIQSITGGFNIGNAVAGKVLITATDPNTATKLAGYYRKIATVAQLLEDPNAGLKLLAEGLTVNQNESQVSLSLNFQQDNLAKLWNWCNLSTPYKPTGSSRPSVAEKRVTVPEPLFNPTPSYTEEARKAKIEGIVVIKLIIRRDGTTDIYKIVKGLGYGLDESAINTISNKWRFIPAIVNGAPVDMTADVNVAFRLY